MRPLALSGHAFGSAALGLLLIAIPLRAGALSPDATFAEALRLEQSGELMASAQRFEEAAESGRRAGFWRAARATWRYAESLPKGQDSARIALFRRAGRLAREGLNTDSHCSACALWRYSSLARLTQLLGLVWSARHAHEMASLLDLGISSHPSPQDPDGSRTLANLYYSRATFYRMIPEWWWLRLVFGVRGDTERALHDIRMALHLSPQRIDYNVEYGAVLLCDGTKHHRPERLREGRGVLQHALALPIRLPSDRGERDSAQSLREHPEQACGWSGKGFIDVEAEGNVLAKQMRTR